MARIVISGLTGHVADLDGKGDRNLPVFLAIDSDTGEVTGHSTRDDAAGVEDGQDTGTEGSVE